jgi:hypothetical protein
MDFQILMKPEQFYSFSSGRVCQIIDSIAELFFGIYKPNTVREKRK